MRIRFFSGALDAEGERWRSQHGRSPRQRSRLGKPGPAPAAPHRHPGIPPLFVAAAVVSCLLGWLHWPCHVLAEAVPGLAEAAPARDLELDAGSGERLVVGIEPDLPPYTFLDERGRPDGQFVDLMVEIAKVMGLRLEFEVGTREETRAAIDRGDMDILLAVSPAEGTEERFTLSLPHTDVDDRIFVGPETTTLPARGGESLRRWLAERQVIALRDDPSADYLAREVPGAEVLLEASAADALRSLAAGEGDCAMLPETTGRLLIRSLGLSNIEALPIELQEYERGYSFAVHPDRRELAESIDEGLTIVTNTRRYMEIYNRWQSYSGDDGRIWQVLAWTLAPALLLLLVSAIWTQTLRRTVARRSLELEREMAERQRLEEQVLEARKLESLGVLAGGIAHDFNNLLMAMLGHVELARLRIDDRDDVGERLGAIEQAGRRAAELTGKMLAYSGHGNFVSEPIEVSGLVGKTVGIWQRSRDEDSGSGVALDLEPELPLIEGDAGQLGQLLLHWLENAAEAIADRPLGPDEGGPTKPRIVVRTGRRYCDREELERIYLGEPMTAGAYVFLEVQDDGVGMDEERIERIFEPFFTTRFTGRGLGLAAAAGIVRGHRGALRVDSELGRGSRFRAYFPFARPEARVVAPSSQAVVAAAGRTEESRASAARSRSATAVDPSGNGVREQPEEWPGEDTRSIGPILIVDDEDAVRYVLGRTLRNAGFETLLAADGEQAVEIFRRHPEIRIVLLDATMPRLGGADTYERLRRMRPEVRVIFSSGYDQERALSRLQGPQLSAFLQKPYNAVELLEALHRAVIAARTEGPPRADEDRPRAENDSDPFAAPPPQPERGSRSARPRSS